MKKISYICLCFLLFCIHSYGQDRTIINELNTYRPTEGSIIIYQDEALNKVLGNKVSPSTSNTTSTTTNANAAIKGQLSTTKDETNTKSTTASKTPTKAKGYRIQVYSGNDQKRSKDEAYARRSQIRSVYPNMDVSITYSSPVWRVRAGNFRSRAEAQQALNEMKSRFSSFGREMHIVDDVIKIY